MARPATLAQGRRPSCPARPFFSQLRRRDESKRGNGSRDLQSSFETRDKRQADNVSNGWPLPQHHIHDTSSALFAQWIARSSYASPNGRHQGFENNRSIGASAKSQCQGPLNIYRSDVSGLRLHACEQRRGGHSHFGRTCIYGEPVRIAKNEWKEEEMQGEYEAKRGHRHLQDSNLRVRTQCLKLSRGDSRASP
ncbi:hypothetical protein V8C40DRAFT_286154 [Trichoderma camerunense]